MIIKGVLKEERRELRTTVYYITEGRVTEPNYLDNFENAHRSANIHFQNLDKTNIDVDFTDVEGLVELAHGILSYHNEGKLTPFYLLKMILDEYYLYWVKQIKNEINTTVAEEFKSYRFDDFKKEILFNEIKNSYYLTDKLTDEHQIFEMYKKSKIESEVKTRYRKCCEDKCDKLQITRKSLTNKIKAEHLLDDNGYIADIECVMRFIKNHLFTYFNDDSFFSSNFLDDFMLMERSPYSILDRDHIFIIKDRDYMEDGRKAESDDEFEKAVRLAKDKYGYDFLLSTPAFEIWLLMHHEGNDYSEYHSERSYLIDIQKRLSKLEGVKDKEKRINAERFNSNYKNKFDFAVQESKSSDLKQSLSDLIRDAGSNVGIMLSRLINK